LATKNLKTRQEVEDFVRGCTFYGTGGGGLPKNGISSLMSEIEEGREIGWVDISEIENNQISVCPFLMGSIAPHDDVTTAEMKNFGLIDSLNREKERMSKAVIELSLYKNQQFDIVVPIELGGANTAAALAVASQLGLKAVDGDYTSRAIPEIVQITPNYNGKSALPIASVDEWGNVCIIKDSVNPRVTERIGKLISVAGYGLAGQAGIVMQADEMKEIIIPGTLTECYEIGKLMRESKEKGLSVEEELIKAANGYILGKGEIVKKEDYDDKGYYWGTVTVNCNDFELKYWFKNENHVVWKNDKPFVSSPDIISAIDLETGEPIPNPLSYIGQKVAIIGIPCKKELRRQECYDVLTPRYFGFDIDYLPIEDVMSK